MSAAITDYARLLAPGLHCMTVVEVKATWVDVYFAVKRKLNHY
jgi:hypothetical protein